MGVSQRDVSQFYPQLVGRQEELRNLVSDFFEAQLREKFPLRDYAFDVYITSKGKVKLLDFNPIGGVTSPLLFSWEELGYDAEAVEPSKEAPVQHGPVPPNQKDEETCQDHADDVLVRLVEKGGGIMLGSKIVVAQPYDMLGASVTEMVEAMKQLDTN